MNAIPGLGRMGPNSGELLLSRSGLLGFALNNRGLAYAGLGGRAQAFENLKMAARLGDKTAQDLCRSQGISW